MNEQTRQMLESLASKLGTTVDHLWGVLVRQAPISSLTDIVLFSTAISILILLFKRISKSRENEGGLLHYADEFIHVVWIAWFAASSFIGITLFFELEYVVAGFFNPEYWALKQLLH